MKPLFLFWAVAAFCAGCGAAGAQTAPGPTTSSPPTSSPGAPAITAPASPLPAPPPARVIAIYGDSLADGIWSGLYDLTRSQPSVRLLRHAKIATGLVRSDFAAWKADVAAQIEAEHPTHAVILFGLNDMQGLRDENRKGHAYKSADWVAHYRDRVTGLVALFASFHVTPIWVSLPVVRNSDVNEEAKYLNGLYQSFVTEGGGNFLSIYQDFTDADGGFLSYIDDDKKRSRQLRLDDGVHFAGYGYQLVAAKLLKRIDELDRAAARPAPTQPAPTQ